MSRSLLLTMFLSACFSPRFSDHPACGVGGACPSGTQCLRAVCVANGCSGVADGDPCANTSVGDGVCYHGGCVPHGCGDGVKEATEACDDGNQVSGDGCSGDCKSNETCGNGFLDALEHEQCDDGLPGRTRDGCSSRCTIEILDWRNVSPKGIPGRSSSAMIFDPRRGRPVIFGGLAHNFVELADTWEFDGASWSLHPTQSSPPPGSDHALAADTMRGRIVLFGGWGTSGLSAETWEFDGVTWTRRTTTTTPPARFGATMVFDSQRGRIVLFGGEGDVTTLEDTWEFDGSDWSLRVTPVSPPPRSGAAMVYDSLRHRIVLFGGDLGGALLADTWTLDASGWRQLTTVASPPARFGHALAYDVLRDRVVLFGGQLGSSSDELANDTWELAGTTWVPKLTAHAPAPRSHLAMAFVPTNNRTLLFGGALGNSGPGNAVGADTWEFDGFDWAERLVEVTPSPREASSMAFDSERGRFLLFGGLETHFLRPFGDTWEFDGLGWISRPTAHAPSARAEHAVAFDPFRRRFVLFGGFDSNHDALADTWEFDGIDWSRLATIAAPPARGDAAVAFDPVRKRLVLFGGSDGDSVLGDTWEFDGITWTQRSPATAPPPAATAGMVFDNGRGTIVLFGGFTSTPSSPRTWQYDGTSWSPIVTAHTPPDQISPGLAFDALRNRIVMLTSQSVMADATWELDTTDWTQITTAVLPPSRLYSTMGFDSTRGRVVLFGGRSFGISVGDTWTLSYDSLVAPDTCVARVDSDGDGLVACGDATHAADPDCAGRCAPTCTALTPMPCAPSASRCGDGACNPFLEDYLLCPVDCPVP